MIELVNFYWAFSLNVSQIHWWNWVNTHWSGILKFSWPYYLDFWHSSAIARCNFGKFQFVLSWEYVLTRSRQKMFACKQTRRYMYLSWLFYLAYYLYLFHTWLTKHLENHIYVPCMYHKKSFLIYSLSYILRRGQIFL